MWFGEKTFVPFALEDSLLLCCFPWLSPFLSVGTVVVVLALRYSLHLRSVSWFPHNVAWTLPVARRELKKRPAFEAIRKWLVKSSEAGSICRQELVSMVPPLLLNLKPHHRVRPCTSFFFHPCAHSWTWDVGRSLTCAPHRGRSRSRP